MKNEKYPRLLSREEVQSIYGIPKRFLEVAVQKSNGPKRVMIGRLVRYRALDIEAWIESCVETG